LVHHGLDAAFRSASPRCSGHRNWNEWIGRGPGKHCLYLRRGHPGGSIFLHARVPGCGPYAACRHHLRFCPDTATRHSCTLRSSSTWDPIHYPPCVLVRIADEVRHLCRFYLPMQNVENVTSPQCYRRFRVDWPFRHIGDTKPSCALPFQVLRLVFGFGISVTFFCGRSSTGAVGTMARIWSFVFRSDFSKKYQSASTRMSLLVVRFSFLNRRTSQIQRMAALSSAVRQTEVRWASSGMCFSLGLMAQIAIDCILKFLHYNVIVQ
jgi:hypothetical protein